MSVCMDVGALCKHVMCIGVCDVCGMCYVYVYAWCVRALCVSMCGMCIDMCVTECEGICMCVCVCTGMSTQVYVRGQRSILAISPAVLHLCPHTVRPGLSEHALCSLAGCRYTVCCLVPGFGGSELRFFCFPSRRY